MKRMHIHVGVEDLRWWAIHTVAYWRCTWRSQIRNGSSPSL